MPKHKEPTLMTITQPPDYTVTARLDETNELVGYQTWGTTPADAETRAINDQFTPDRWTIETVEETWAPHQLQPFTITTTNPQTGDTNTATVYAPTRHDALTRAVLNGSTGFYNYQWRNLEITGANHA